MAQFRLPRGQRSVFAERLGITPAYLSQILSGQKQPSLGLALRISSESKGQISLEELCPLDDGEPYPLAARLRASDPIPTPDELRRRALALLAEESAA